MSEREQFEAEWARIGWPDGPNTKEQCLAFWQASRRTALEELQQNALDRGFKYWRAPDAHGVTATNAQAVDLLQDLLGVEVEIGDRAENRDSDHE